MNEENINKNSGFQKVLVAPLDWGLGHVTRCIPIIHTLLREKAIVFVAAEGAAKNLLQKEFHNITILPLRGYDIQYPAKKSLFFLKMAMQFPKVFLRINREKKWLRQIVAKHRIDAVISDNRFGLALPGVYSIYITHQLYINTGKVWLDIIAQRIHYRFINRFNECWVPDMHHQPGLGGILSHPQKMPSVPVKYLGPLSRFRKMKEASDKKNLLIILSGPEPQRTIFEKMLLKDIDKMMLEDQHTITLVRGLPGTEEIFKSPFPQLLVFNHLPANALQALIEDAQIVVARSGYSTIMDLSALQQKAILVPTPGQTEQEYLAKFLKEERLFFTHPQKNFSLKNCLSAAKDFDYRFIDVSSAQMENVVTNFLKNLPVRL